MADDHTVLGRALIIIDAVLDSATPVSLANLARSTGLPKPTTRRIANTLAGRGLLVRTSRGYVSGPGLAELGARASAQMSDRLHALPHLQELYARTHAVTWLIDVTGERSWPVISSVFDRTIPTYGNDIWPRNPVDPAILATALGQLTYSNDVARAEGLLQSGVPQLTRHTPVQPNRIIRSLIRADEEQVAVEYEQVRLGWSCLAVPVTGRSNQRAVLGLVERTPRFQTARFVTEARRVADDLSRTWTIA